MNANGANKVGLIMSLIEGNYVDLVNPSPLKQFTSIVHMIGF